MNQTAVGLYRIVRELGAGGMGAVYEAVDTMLDRTVAIKMLHAEISRNPELIERFHVEAVTLGKLNHPSIATLYSFFREGEEYFMVMEFVPGRSLEQIIQSSGALAAGQAAAILRQVLDAMAHAHRLGVLHRDIKPANIMVTPEGMVKVTDFGIARFLGAARVTRDGHIVGTLEYIAPERIRGEEADIRSDLYSAGVVLYEALAGELPFKADSDYALMHAHLSLEPPPLDHLAPGAMSAIVQKALAKNPAERFQTAEEFRDALVTPAAALPNAGTLKPTRPVAVPAALPPTRLAELPPARREPPVWVYGIPVVAATMIAAVYFAVRPSPKPPQPPPQTAIAQPAPAPPPVAAPPLQQPIAQLPAGLIDSAKPAIQPGALSNLIQPRETSEAVTTLQAVRKLYVAHMAEGLDDYIRDEIADQHPGQIAVVTSRQEADAVMTAKLGKKQGLRTGMRSSTFANATIANREGKVLWSGEADDQSRVLAALKLGGPKKVADKLVTALRKSLER